MPQNMPTLEMVRLFPERSWIEQGYQQLKEELGLDHHEGRAWIGWLVFPAFGYLTQLRLQEKNGCSRAWGRRNCRPRGYRRKVLPTEGCFGERVEAQKVSNAFLKTMAAKTTGTENAFVAPYPPSIGKMLDEIVELIIYLSE